MENSNSLRGGSSYKQRDSKNDWRDSREIKMNNLEFFQFLANLKIVCES